ncbi:MAG: beta-ketoacyl-ACP synthase II [Thermoflexales bacterium]|nr:beta-ketoacyl-ACP synthase II [Thermoflexales bacterium]MCS7324334.1 beta-ketoacyl-ACP synthase II [Thermoflexales bacterium]MCX7937910.1 beta-ketoacyl-ACP synthase II [Thermoflexales bacterium]MDW8053783.1 beta-ketoacyl-ACP synthase II [Anaerolineae bacterium]MDW8293303.1 beta-ketoacyl-ACP synthase II [Anaerolineae bacterium]
MSASNQQTHRVVVTGMGMITPLGHTVQETWDALVAGRSGVDYISLFDHRDFDVHIAAEVKDFDPAQHFGSKEARRMDRVTHLALVAARQALEDANLKISEDNTYDIGVVIGSGIGGITTLLNEHTVMLTRGHRRISPFTVPMMLADAATGQIAIQFGIRGPNLCIVTACASGANAIGEAFEMIRSGRVRAALTGGCESPINPFSMSAFHNMGALSTYNDDPKRACRPFDKTRNGFVTGEGAAMLMLESLEHAQARGARIYAEIVGYGATDDAFHITAPDVKGPAMAMRRALQQAGIEPHEVDYINAHGTGTPLNDVNETRAIKEVFGEAAYDVNISSTKSMTAHSFGAVGAIEAIVCVQAINHGVIPPTINYEVPDPECDLNYTPNVAVRRPVRVALTNSFGFGGHNAALVFRAFGG